MRYSLQNRVFSLHRQNIFGISGFKEGDLPGKKYVSREKLAI